VGTKPYRGINEQN